MNTDLLALVCHHCSGALPLCADERVLVCPACLRSWTPAGGAVPRLELQPRQLVAPRLEAPEGASIVVLPVWIVRVHGERLGSVGERMTREIRVPAVGLSRMPLLLQFARNLTRAAAPIEIWTDVRVAVEPAELTAEDAFAVAELVALRQVEGWPPEGEEDVEIPLGGARLTDWPAALRGSELTELVSGVTVHHGLFGSHRPADRRAELGAWLGAHPEPPPRPRA